MGLYTLNPTTNVTPDPGQGGSAVSGISNTGHTATVSAASIFGDGFDGQTKTAKWSAFTSISPGQIASIRLKLTWAASGNANASGGGADGSASATSSFAISYSINGGGAWLSVTSSSCTANDPGTPAANFLNNSSADILLSSAQDLTQVQVRDSISAVASAFTGSGSGASSSCSANVSVSSIRLELTTVDVLPIVAI